MENYFVVVLLYIFLGMFAGFSSGLLGIGGGAIIVPGLIMIFQFQHFPEANLVHIAAGTSLAVIVVATLRGLLSYYRPEIRFFEIYKLLIPGLVIGVIGGAILAHYLKAEVLQIIFGVFVVGMALKMLMYHGSSKTYPLPGFLGMNAFALFTGAQSGLLGLGGGTFTIPFLTYCGVDKHSTQMNALAVSLTTAFFGTATVMITGSHVAHLPIGSVGYVYWPAWLAIALGALITVPLGTRLAYRAPVVLLRRLFASFLLIVAVHLFWTATS